MCVSVVHVLCMFVLSDLRIMLRNACMILFDVCMSVFWFVYELCLICVCLLYELCVGVLYELCILCMACV